MKVFIINVGVNASHGSLRSPIFEDGSFEFVPIPEPSKTKGCPGCEYLPQYSDLFEDKLHLIPQKHRPKRVHNDPEFETYTYGDYPTEIPRAANLKRMEEGDLLFFLARLVDFQDGGFTDNAGLYLVGFLEVDDLIKLNSNPPEEKLRKVEKNAHVRKAHWDDKFFDNSWVFKGSENSKLFDRAIPLTKGFAVETLDGESWGWPKNRTDTQVIGSRLRACKKLEGSTVSGFLEALERRDVSLEGIYDSSVSISDYVE